MGRKPRFSFSFFSTPVPNSGPQSRAIGYKLFHEISHIDQGTTFSVNSIISKHEKVNEWDDEWVVFSSMNEPVLAGSFQIGSNEGPLGEGPYIYQIMKMLNCQIFIYLLMLNFTLISKMYNFVWLYSVLFELCLFKVWKWPVLALLRRLIYESLTLGLTPVAHHCLCSIHDYAYPVLW